MIAVCLVLTTSAWLVLAADRPAITEPIELGKKPLLQVLQQGSIMQKYLHQQKATGKDPPACELRGDD